MINRLLGFHPLGFRGEVPARIEVSVEPGEIAARYLHPDAVAFFEHIAGGPEVDVVFVDPAGLYVRGVLRAVAEAGADDTVTNVYGFPVGIDIEQLPGEIRVHRRASCM